MMVSRHTRAFDVGRANPRMRTNEGFLLGQFSRFESISQSKVIELGNSCSMSRPIPPPPPLNLTLDPALTSFKKLASKSKSKKQFGIPDSTFVVLGDKTISMFNTRLGGF